MENPDQISDSEVEERIYNLERIVKRFRIASSGDGNVLGGFGKFFKPPEELTFEERIGNLESAANQFSIDGNNVRVSGTFDDGFELT